MPFTNLDACDLSNTKGNSKFNLFSANDIAIESNEDLMKELNKLNSNEEMENETAINCKYMSIDDMNNLELNKTNHSILHLNISSLPYHIDDLKTVLSQCTKPFDVIGITETRIKKGSVPYTDISLDGYNYESQPTESSAGGVQIYLSTDIKYKCRSDLNIYKSRELESVFVETLNVDSNNFILGYVYKHPNMSISEFNKFYLGPLNE